MHMCCICWNERARYYFLPYHYLIYFRELKISLNSGLGSHLGSHSHAPGFVLNISGLTGIGWLCRVLHVNSGNFNCSFYVYASRFSLTWPFPQPWKHICQVLIPDWLMKYFLNNPYYWLLTLKYKCIYVCIHKEKLYRKNCEIFFHTFKIFLVTGCIQASFPYNS